MINSSYVLARWLAGEAPGARCFVIGEPPLVEELGQRASRRSMTPG